MSEFDFGDELFDDVDVDQLLSSQPARAAKRKREPETDVLNDGSDQKKKSKSGDNVIVIDDDEEEKVVIDDDAFFADDVSDDLELLDGDPALNAAQMRIAQKLLTETFGYEAFRHEQEGAIGRILAGANALTVFPTGAGKSLLPGLPSSPPMSPFEWSPDKSQIPAIAFEKLDLEDKSRPPGEHGVTIVVSPLIALMKDQVDALQQRNVPADCIDSTKTWEQQQQTHAALREGKLRILYCAPERLNNEGFVATMQHVRGGVRLLAVDEAHCVSEWGHSFRPEYLKVARFADEIKAERIICLTATATPKVIEDICSAFKILPEGVFRTSAYRPNLNLYAQAVTTKQDKYPLIFQFLSANPGPTLVYVTLQKQSEVLAADLRDQGFDAVAFHAGIKTDDKIKVQDNFLANRVRIVVATIAFGMGIDKPDIRNILHFDLSSTVEEYCQQVGRAGRDEKPSNCMFYICPDDWYIRENFARGDLPSPNSLRGLMLDIFSDENAVKPVGESFKTNHSIQGRNFDIRANPLATIYAALELRFGLIRAITPEYSEYKFVATPPYFGRMKLDKSPAFKAIYEGAVKKAKFHHLDVNGTLLRTKGLQRIDLIRKLNEMHDSGAIELKAGGIEQKYRILKPLPRSSKEIESLVKDLHADLTRRESDALHRTQEVEDLITGN